MIYVFKGGSVVYDGSTLTEEQKARSVAVESLPIPEKIVGKTPVLKVDVEKQEVWYEYEDLVTESEDNDIKLALAELAEQQEQDKLNTQLAIAELAEAVLGGAE